MTALADSKPVSVEAKPGLATALLSVFSSGPYSPKLKTVNKPWFNSFPPKPLNIVYPEEKGTYEVILFFHGTALSNTSYSNLLDHLASHGYIVVAPQVHAHLTWSHLISVGVRLIYLPFYILTIFYKLMHMIANIMNAYIVIRFYAAERKQRS